MYKTELAAKRAANKFLNPVVARMGNGQYDWFPKGHPLGTMENGQFVRDKNAVIVSYYDSFAGRWVEWQS